MKGRKPQSPERARLTAPVRSVRAPKAEKKTKGQVAVEALTIGSVSPPPSLKGIAVEVWNALAPGLVAAKLLGALDVAAFARYCRLAARFEQAAKTLDDEGLTYESESNHGKLKRAHPAVMLELRYARELASLEGSFGLTPADRQRIFAERARVQGLGALFGDDAAPTSSPPPKSGEDEDFDETGALRGEQEPEHRSPVGILN